MNELHTKLISDNKIVPREGQRDLVCSNIKSLRCPSFGVNNNSSEDASLDYLAKILVEAFLDKKEYERKQLCEPKESSNLLSSINKRAS
jgi:hypothetical protein